MSQETVEHVIGRLITDEGFRRRFACDPESTLDEIARCGCSLNHCERRALAELDVSRFERFADGIDPRLAKVDLSGGLS